MAQVVSVNFMLLSIFLFFFFFFFRLHCIYLHLPESYFTLSFPFPLHPRRLEEDSIHSPLRARFAETRARMGKRLLRKEKVWRNGR